MNKQANHKDLQDLLFARPTTALVEVEIDGVQMTVSHFDEERRSTFGSIIGKCYASSTGESVVGNNEDLWEVVDYLVYRINPPSFPENEKKTVIKVKRKN